MDFQKEKLFFLFGLLFCCVVLLVVLTFSYVQAGAPQIRERCQGPDGRQIPTIYDSNLPVFAEARMLSRAEQREAKEKGISAYFIVVNPERYYLGQYTQIWLYRRQCAHILEQHKVVREGYRQLEMRDEQQADCLAIEAMQKDTNLSNRQIDSIERDIERLIQKKRWAEVLPGPQRRISLRRCPSLKHLK